jgi:hypothetical protein
VRAKGGPESLWGEGISLLDRSDRRILGIDGIDRIRVAIHLQNVGLPMLNEGKRSANHVEARGRRMSAGHLTRQEGMEAGGQAQRIQRAINTVVGRRLVRCIAPVRLRPRDVSSPDQDVRYGLELRIEPLVTVTDFRYEPARKIAAKLREWATLLNQAVASPEQWTAVAATPPAPPPESSADS